MAGLMLSIALSLFLCVNSQPSTYQCPANEECQVDCTNIENFMCNTNGTGLSMIDAFQATSLEVWCHDDNACDNMLIECPISHSAFCTIHCDLTNSCNSMELHTHNVTNFSLLCGANEADRGRALDTQCTNITIDGIYGDKNDRPPPTQNITIICNDEGNDASINSPSCDLIMTKNIAQMDTVIPNSVVTLNILCTVDWEGKEETKVCHRMYIDAGKAKYVNILIEGDLTNSILNLTDLALLEVGINVIRFGTVLNSTINAPEVQNRFHIKSNSTIGFLHSNIIGPYIHYQTPVEIETQFPSRFEMSTFEGRFYIHGNGYYLNSQFNSKTAGLVNINVGEMGVWENNRLMIEDSNASLSFFGSTSGYIDAKHSAIVSIICKSYDPNKSCNGLILDVPSYTVITNTTIKKQRAFLECIDYGCTNITTISEHGADDIAVTAVLCNCDKGGNGENGNSCIGVININCGDNKAIFDGVECNGYTECCGPIISETTAALCDRIKHNKSGLNDWEVVGVTIGVIIGLLLITSLICYCQNQRTLRDQFKRAQDTNPYTQTIIDDDKDINVTSAGKYGAVTDDAM